MPTPIAADLSKDLQSFAVVIPAASNAAQTVTPTVGMESATVFNTSAFLIRATVAFAAGIAAGVAVANRTFVIPPNSVASVDFSQSISDDVSGSVPPIASITFQAINAPTATGAHGAGVAPASLATAAVLHVNLVSA